MFGRKTWTNWSGDVTCRPERIATPATLEALTGDPGLAGAWRTMPCTRSGHHAYMGGLVEHTVGVAAVVQALAVWHPRLDADLLLAHVLDVGLGRLPLVDDLDAGQLEQYDALLARRAAPEPLQHLTGSRAVTPPGD